MFKRNLTIVLKKRNGAAWRRFIKRAGAIVTALLLLLTVLPPVTALAAGGTPTVTASAASNVNSTACTLNGSITDNGGDTIMEYGFYYGLFPSIQHDAGHRVQVGSSDYTGSFSTNLTGLTLGAAYYFEAYATNHSGTAYSTPMRSVTLAGANSAIASADNTVFHAGAQGSFTIIATGDPLPTISETGALPSGVTFTDNGNGTATLSGKPAIGTDGSWPITITAHNTVPSDATQSFTLTVGLADPPYFSGRGTEADPWLIQSAADLAQMRDLVNSQTSPWADAGVYYKLTQNIDLSAYATATITATGLDPWEDATPGIGWTPIGYGASFKGVFDGNGKTVSGLYINYPLDGGYHMGLFGMIYTDAVVKNLGVVKCDVTGHRNVGGLVGWSAGGIIENCYVTGRISCWRGAGGLVGKFYNYDSNTTLANGYIKNCYTDCTITGGGGGLVECLTDGTITNCYSAGVVVDGQGSVAGGIVGWLDSGIMTNDPDAYSTVKDCVALQLRNAGIYPYDNDEIHARGRIYGYIYENTPPAFSGNYAWSGMTGFNYPLASSTNDGQNGADLTTADACVAAIQNIGFTDFTAADLPAYITGYFTGGGTESDPYQISTVDDLENLALDVNNGVNFDGKYFKLMNDLDLAGSYRNWSPIGSDMRTYNNNAADTYKFNGIFDGNGKTIRHLSNSAGYGTVGSDGHYIFVGQYYMGLFGYIGSGGTVKNLNLTDVSLNGYAYYVGGLAGECDGVIDHCNVSGSIQTRGYTTDMHQVSVGGIVGAGVGSKLVISNCSAAGQIGSAAYLVGPTGGSYVGAYYAGGVAGMVLINDDGETVYYTGGQAGLVTNSSFSGDVLKSGYSSGGLIGVNYATVTNCHTEGSVQSSGTLTGIAAGLIGYNRAGLIENCYSTSTVTSSGGAAGFIGVNDYLYFYTADDQTHAHYIGGTIRNCYSTGQVTCNSDNGNGACMASGFLISNSGTVEYCYSTGNVNGDGQTAGFVGNNRVINNTLKGVITNCYCTGTVSGPAEPPSTSYSYCAVFAAVNYSVIQNCIALNQSISGTYTHIGRMAGYNYGTNFSFIDNYAWSGMTVNGSTVTGTTTDNNGGDLADWAVIRPKLAGIGFTNVARPVYIPLGMTTDVAFTAEQAGGTSGTADSTGIVLTFSETVTSLTADDITITNDSGSVTKGTLSGSDTIWTIALDGVASQGDVTVSVADFGSFHITTVPQTVAVYKAVVLTPITLQTAVADGEAGTMTSTKIDLTFDTAIAGLTASDITITDGTGAAVKGALTGSGTNWSIALTSVATQGNVTVAVVAPAGYSISGSPKTVAVYKAIVPTAVTLQSAAADGVAGTTTSTKIDLTFDTAITGLTASDITITDGTGSVVKGALTGSGTSWSIALTSVATQGNVSVAVSAPAGYTMSGSSKTVAVYKAVALTPVTLQTAVADGAADATTSTKIDLSFDTAIAGLTASDITITDGTGAAVKGALTGSGTSWSIALTSVTTQGNVSIAVAVPAGYTISGSPKTVAVYKAVVPTAVTLQTAVADGVADTITSTKIDLTFDTAISGLTASDITITNGTGAAVKGALTGSGTNWSIAFTSVTTQGNVSVAVSAPAGYTISGSPKTVAVCKAVALTPVTLQAAVADGAADTTTSTKIDFTFNTAITGLTASDIIITNGTGTAVKGALTGSGTNWSIALTSVTTQGNVSVAVSAPAGYSISGSPKTVAVYKAVVPTAVTLLSAAADGVVDTTTSTKIDLTFDTAIAGLTASDITITSGSGAAVKGALTGSGTSWSIALTSVTTQGNVSVAVSAPAGYSISGSPKTVAVYKAVVLTPVTLQTAVADGMADTTTSAKIDLTFDTAIAGLTASDITITDGTGAAVKGDLTGSGTNWSIALTSVTTQGNVSVAVAAPSGYTLSGSPKTVAVYKAAVPIVTVTSVTVAPPTVSVQKGTTQTFTAAVNGTNSPAQTVTWSVYGNTSISTTINASGLLTVAADETAATLTVTATSTVDNSKSGTATVTVTITPPAFVAVTDITSVPATATAGTPLTLTGTVAPVDATNQTVAWSVYNAGDTGASIVGNTLSTTAAGIVVVRATITNGLTESTDYTQDFNITVAAAPVTTYTVTASADSGGTISPAGSVSVTEGSSQTFTITSNSGYQIHSVTVDGVNQGAITTYTFTNVTANHTITATFTRTSGGDGGGGGGSPSTPATPAAPTYNADVKAGNSTETTLPVTVDKDKGTASTDVGSQKLTSSGTVITVPSIPDVNAYSVGIPVPNLSTSDVQGTLTLHTDNGSITVPSNMLAGVSSISGSKAEITIGQGNKENLRSDVKAAIGDRPLVQLTLSIDGKQTDWNNRSAPVTVSISYTPTAAERANPESIVVWYIDGSGKVVTVPNGHYDQATGRVTFDATHFSDYAVAYNRVSFGDVAAGAWYNKAVGFIAARGITSGTGNGKYSPEAKLTRGEFIVLVMRAYGIAPDTDLANNFSDAGNTYYTGYLAAAKRLGISSGVGNNMYAPGNEITRQEMFTLLYHVLKVIGQLPGTHGRAVGEANDQPQGDSGKSLSSFSDAGQIASWAKDAMTLLVETGTIGGNNGRLTPASTTTRAEMVQVLYKLLLSK